MSEINLLLLTIYDVSSNLNNQVTNDDISILEFIRQILLRNIFHVKEAVHQS